MDNKQEREKVIEAAKDFWLNNNRSNYTFYEDLADFHLAETETLRRQLAEANEIIAQYGYKSQWRCGGEGVSRKVEN